MTATVTELDPFAILDAEAARLDQFFGSLSGSDWDRPSRAEGWSVRDVLGHLAGGEAYNHACLNDEVPAFLATVGDAGVQGIDGFNQWTVDQRHDLPVDDVLAEWRGTNRWTRDRLRALGRDAELPTMAGPYPVGLQALHLASEIATHADDVGARAVGPDEPSRTDWRLRFGRYALTERDAPPSVELSEPDGRVIVTADAGSAQLSPAEFVEATVGRLPADHPLDDQVRQSLRCLA
ncbi:MAG: maleylpyruvate isomerase family mycothiol-dependent enzyme [Actinocatenispora sp.]